MNDVRRGNKVHTTDAQRIERRQHRCQHGAARVPRAHGAGDECIQHRKRADNVRRCGELGVDKAEVAGDEYPDKRGIRRKEAAPYADTRRDLVFLIAGVGKALDNERYEIIYPQCCRQQHQQRYPPAQHRLCLTAGEKLLYQPHHAQARREGDIRLIYPQHRCQQHHARRAPAPSAARKQAHGDNGEEDRQRVGRTCEHVAEVARECGECRDSAAEQRLRHAPPYLKAIDHHAHRRRDEQQPDNAVYPRHGHVREQKLCRLKSPAPGGQRRALGKERRRLVRVEQLICEGVHMRKEARDECRREGHGVPPRRACEGERAALAQREVFITHLLSPPQPSLTTT